MAQDKEKKYFLYRFARAVMTPVYSVIYRPQFTNTKSLPEGGCILCCNHISYADPIIAAMGQKRQIRYMAKIELFRNKILGPIVRGLGAFPVDRGHANETGINRAEEVLSNGEVLGIFPEGTRSKNGELLRIRSGAVMLAAAHQVPILPVCITPRGGMMKNFNKIKVTYGRLLTPEEMQLTGEKPNLRYASKLLTKTITEIREKDKF